MLHVGWRVIFWFGKRTHVDVYYRILLPSTSTFTFEVFHSSLEVKSCVMQVSFGTVHASFGAFSDVRSKVFANRGAGFCLSRPCI